MSLDDTTTKRCTKCGELKPRDQFGQNRNNRDGLMALCKTCRAAYRSKYKDREREQHKIYLSINRDAVLEQKRRHREESRDAILEYARLYRTEHHDAEIERTRLWRIENREAILERRRQRYINNHEAELTRKRKWRAGNRESERERTRQRRIENPDIFRASKHRRRARENQAGGNCTTADLAAIRAAQTDAKGRLICWACNKPINGLAELDHWIPIKEGGSSNPGNLHFMHVRCNRSKGAKMPSEIGRLL
jgi:5-methylcytosine-specific restriction endonuclease McrA